MIVVDSSVWIDHFNGAVTRETEILDTLLGVERGRRHSRSLLPSTRWLHVLRTELGEPREEETNPA